MKGVVPSVFEEYPRYLQPSTKAPRSDAAIRKKKKIVIAKIVIAACEQCQRGY